VSRVYLERLQIQVQQVLQVGRDARALKATLDHLVILVLRDFKEFLA
jgi:hypothetical protein